MHLYFKMKFLSHWSYEKNSPHMIKFDAISSVPLFAQDLFLQAQKPHFKIDADFPIHTNMHLLCGLMTVSRMQNLIIYH